MALQGLGDKPILVIGRVGMDLTPSPANTRIREASTMMVAMSRAPASALQPFNYMSLPWGIVLSYTVFGHLIDPIALVGGAVIVGAGLVVMARERRLALRGRRTEPVDAEEGPSH